MRSGTTSKNVSAVPRAKRRRSHEKKSIVQPGAIKTLIKKRALTQISARVPGELKNRFDALVERKGLRKEFVIEEALRYHLRALEEIPAEYIIPTRIVLTAESSHDVAAALEQPPKPSQELIALFKGPSRAGDD